MALVPCIDLHQHAYLRINLPNASQTSNITRETGGFLQRRSEKSLDAGSWYILTRGGLGVISIRPESCAYKVWFVFRFS
jgi:hypothetical protein